MLTAKNLCDLIIKGGVFNDIKGSSVEEVYDNFSKKIKLPDGLYPENVKAELIEREKILSTAVGNSVAIPHPRKHLICNPADERIAVCFSRENLDMHSPDSTNVFAFFVLLTYSSKSHLEILSTLASLVQNKAFISILKTKPDQNTLVEEIKNILQ